MAITQRQKRILSAGAGGYVAVTSIAALWALVIVNGRGHIPTTLIILLTALSCGTMLLAIVPYWRRLDDRQREARLTSWYWGAGFGAMLGVLTATAVGGRGSMFALGAVLVVAIEVAGYYAARLISWQLNRPRAS
jgi:hypothetical protein